MEDFPDQQPQSAYGGHGSGLLAEIWALTIIALVLVSLRVYMRLALDKGSSWSVYLAVGAWLLGLGATISMTIAILNGIGNHIITIVQAGKFAAAIQPFWVSTSFINLSLSVGKLSIIALLLDVQGKTHPISKTLLYFTAVSNVIVYVVFIIIIFLQCQPSSGIWNLAVAIAGTCQRGSRRAIIMALFAGAWGAATDLFLALYPSYLLFNVQIDRNLKLGVCILMGLGVLTAICSSVKTAYFPVLENGPDETYHVAPLMAWGLYVFATRSSPVPRLQHEQQANASCSAEMWVLLIASSIAPLWPLARRWHHRLSTLSAPRRSKASGPSTAAGHTMPSARVSWTGGQRERERRYKQLDSSEAVYAAGTFPLDDVGGRQGPVVKDGRGEGKGCSVAAERSWV